MASVEGRLAAIEQRLQRLEQAGRLETVEDKGQVETGELRQRVEALEVQLRRMPSGSGDEWAAAPATRWETRAYDPQEETSAGLKAVREAFENDNNADQAWQEELENAAPLFDAEELGSLEFRQIDCRASYCRLMYDDNSAGGAEAEMAENELLILLAKKYGQDIVVYGGERKDRSKTVYLKLPQE